MGTEYVLEMQNISKSFGGVHALRDVTLKVRRGEIHSLIGENGAGKSTLMKILSGVTPMDQGAVLLKGKEAHIRNTIEARRQGISIIYQELNFVSHLTVAENVFLGDQISLSHGLISHRDLNRKCREVFEKIHFDIDPVRRMGELSVAYQQMVEVAKAVSHNADIIVFDEPTAVLSSSESEKLFEIIRELKDKGTSIIYISHRMPEIFDLSDSITVLKDGTLVGTYEREALTEAKAISLMVGRELSSMYPEKHCRPGDVVLEVKGLNAGKCVRDVSFTVRSGEILGLTGLVGAGKTETIRAVFGADQAESGEIIVSGKRQTIRSTRQAIRNGILYVSEDRKRDGVILDMSIRHNVTLAGLSAFTNRLGWINGKKESARVGEMVELLRIKAGSTDDPVSSLSGGNQQKVSLAKWLSLKHFKVIMLDEPTRGIDVGAKQEIYKLIAELAENGCAVVVASSEMMEVIGICTRVIVMYEGRVSGELSGEEITENRIMERAFGMGEE